MYQITLGMSQAKSSWVSKLVETLGRECSVLWSYLLLFKKEINPVLTLYRMSLNKKFHWFIGLNEDVVSSSACNINLRIFICLFVGLFI